MSHTRRGSLLRSTARRDLKYHPLVEDGDCVPDSTSPTHVSPPKKKKHRRFSSLPLRGATHKTKGKNSAHDSKTKHVEKIVTATTVPDRHAKRLVRTDTKVQLLKDEVESLRGIGVAQLDAVVMRGENLETLDQTADDLKIASSEFRGRTRSLHTTLKCEKYRGHALVAVTVIVMLTVLGLVIAASVCNGLPCPSPAVPPPRTAPVPVPVSPSPVSTSSSTPP